MMRQIALVSALLAACGGDRLDPHLQVLELEQVGVKAAPPPAVELVIVQDSGPEPDCSGLLEQREVGKVGKSSIQSNGKFAAGDMAGDAFIPLLYFNTKEQAMACAQGLRIREFRKGRWVTPFL